MNVSHAAITEKEVPMSTTILIANVRTNTRTSPDAILAMEVA
jgi:hypothetical protein